MTASLQKLPVAILTADDILTQAAEALREHERLTQALKASTARLRSLCRQYDQAAGVWGFQTHHLAQACKSRGMM